MKFLVDAQLPVRLGPTACRSRSRRCPTSELPDGNQTTDAEITRRADDEDRVVVTEDRDFRDSHLLRSVPRRLLVVATGNITNNDLLSLFDRHLDAIVAALEEAPFVELAPDRLIVRDR